MKIAKAENLVRARLKKEAQPIQLSRNTVKPGKPLPYTAYGDPRPDRSALSSFVPPEERPVRFRLWSNPNDQMRQAYEGGAN